MQRMGEKRRIGGVAVDTLIAMLYLPDAVNNRKKVTLNAS